MSSTNRQRRLQAEARKQARQARRAEAFQWLREIATTQPPRKGLHQ